MFEVLVPAPTGKSAAGTWPRRKTPGAGPAPMAGLSGRVDRDRVAAFLHLQGQRIFCHSGNLWVTLENDSEDHVLAPGECFLVPSAGKVVIGGRGSYTL